MPDTRGESLQRAVHNVLTRTFNLRRDQNLLIFTDAGSLDVVELIARTAREQGVTTTALFVPRVLQSDMGPTQSLPLPVEAAVREADAILSCLSDLPEHLNYRMRVLHTGWSRRSKLAHAPGLTAETLRCVDTDYAAIGEASQLLSLALLLGHRMQIVTSDSRGLEYRLSVDIGGWDYPPGINDGVIPNGAWANLPPGEVYVVPRDGSGKIVINGSLPGRVLAANEELILTFREGRLVEIEPEGCPAARHLRDTQIVHAERRGDPNWSNLAEVGFGLNPAIHELTGIGAVDEKRAHTIHIGLGHSLSLGGDVDSVIHCDLIIKRPTVYINGRQILKRGDWRLNAADWQLDHRTVEAPTWWWSRLTQIGRSGIRTERDAGRLLCVWNAGRGRWDNATVGVESTARWAARLYDLLPDGGGTLARDLLVAGAERAGIPEAILPGLLWVLHRFDLVRLPGVTSS